LDIVEPVVAEGAIVSSSRVRDLIRAGNVEQARELLSAPYRIRGMVTHGAGRGAKIGFPTANLSAVDTLLPALGVYAGKAWVGDSAHAAAINLGPAQRLAMPLSGWKFISSITTNPCTANPSRLTFSRGCETFGHLNRPPRW